MIKIQQLTNDLKNDCQQSSLTSQGVLVSGGGLLPAEAVQISIERHSEGDPHESG